MRRRQLAREIEILTTVIALLFGPSLTYPSGFSPERHLIEGTQRAGLLHER